MIEYKVYSNEGSREINEDRAGIALSDDSYCFAVADGLGGHGNGEIAAQAAINAVCTLFVEEGFSESFFERAFSAAQEAIISEQERMHAQSRMKTTLVILVVTGKKAIWAHVGDTRLYCFKRNKIKTRTIDHSVPQMLAISGEIKDSEIRHHPDRNRLMRVMGIHGESPRYDVGNAVKLSGEYHFLLCSDGFWELIDENEMEQCLKNSRNSESWIEKMTETVIANGLNTEMDNFTAIAVHVKEKSLIRGLV